MHEVRSIECLLSQISRDEILLPEFQRGYVWTRKRVRGLMQSLYRCHPTGHRDCQVCRAAWGKAA